MLGARHPVLLLHGQPGNPRDWDRVVAELGGRARVLAIARPGWDGHSRPGGLEENAAAALHALDSADVDQAVIVGHSLGAAVAAWTAAAHPERAAALVLLAPAANTESLVPADRLLAAPIVGDVLAAAALAAAGGALATGSGRRLLGAALGADVRGLRGWSRVLISPRSWHAFSFEQRMLLRELPTLEQRLGEIVTATTIMAGTADRVVPLRSARRLAGQIPGARLVALEGAHHLVHHQRPAEVAKVILNSAAGER